MRMTLVFDSHIGPLSQIFAQIVDMDQPGDPPVFRSSRAHNTLSDARVEGESWAARHNITLHNPGDKPWTHLRP